MEHRDFELSLSLERFGRYQAWAAGDRSLAIELYTLNTQLSACLYLPLQTLEVALRNRIHTVLTDRRGASWLEQDSAILVGPFQQEQVEKVIESLCHAGKAVNPGAIVAGLTFSFWTTMFNKDYETLWQQTLHGIADPAAPRGLKRKNFSTPLTRIRLLRNRIAHHEPILSWDLLKLHGQMMELIEWLSPSAAGWCREHDRFPVVYPSDGFILHPSHAKPKPR